MASYYTEVAGPNNQRRFSFGSALRRAFASVKDDAERSRAQRTAGLAFSVRVASAAITYLGQVVLARWMGGSEFGIYVYVWTWVLLLGGLADLGLATAAQRFIPELVHAKAWPRLRGFLRGSRLVSLGLASGVAGLGIFCIWLARASLDQKAIIPLYLGCACVPLFTLGSVQGGIARSFEWTNIALLPPYIVRPILLIVVLAGAVAAGVSINATTTMTAALVTIVITAVLQVLLLNAKLGRTVERGQRVSETSSWLRVSLPMFATGGFYFLLSYIDVLVLQHFRPPAEVAIYYAASKTIGLVAFVYFAMATAMAHRFSAHQAKGDLKALSAAVRYAVRWTFLPSLVATVVLLAVGRPLLWLFGPEFVAGYHLMFVLGLGLLARASVGPAERLLNMLGQQRLCAAVYVAAFTVALVGCIVLVPRLGIDGAAIATAGSLVLESALLFIVARHRLKLHPFILGGK